MAPKQKKLIFDTIIFFLSLSIAWYLIRSGLLSNLVEAVLPIKFIAEFISGLFYASFLTSPISVAMIVVLAKSSNPIILAMIAGLGAASTDLLIVKFFRKGLSKEMGLISHELHLKRINTILVKLKLDFLIPVLGAIIIASPLPDELGLVMLGVSRLKYREIAVLTYILNTAGILLIVIPINLIT